MSSSNTIEFQKVLISLEAALNEKKSDITRDASIQRFKLCIELAWKTAKKIMGTASTAPKQVVREMAQNGLIYDTELWLRSIDERNLSSYTYNEILAEKIYMFTKEFLPHAKNLLVKLQEKQKNEI